jgi:hypothetical protein
MKRNAGGTMSKIGRQTAAVKVARLPAWISDSTDQKQWNGRFIGILNRDYRNSDTAISAILNNEKLAQICAVKIRSYVDKRVTTCLNEQRKARGAKHKQKLEIAVAGLNEAIDLYMERSNRTKAVHLGTVALELSAELERCKEAYATKRHGRDRAHSILSECCAFLESKLGRPVNYVTLANLVNAGNEADGKPAEALVTEERIRKNLAHFKSKNPRWKNEVDPRLKPHLVDPATK